MSVLKVALAITVLVICSQAQYSPEGGRDQSLYKPPTQEDIDNFDPRSWRPGGISLLDVGVPEIDRSVRPDMEKFAKMLAAMEDPVATPSPEFLAKRTKSFKVSNIYNQRQLYAIYVKNAQQPGIKPSFDAWVNLLNEPEKKECNIDALSNQTSESTRQYIDWMKEAKDPSTLMDLLVNVIADLDPLCVTDLKAKLLGDFEGKRVTCNAVQAKSGVCNSAGDISKIMIFVRCLARADLCEFSARLLDDPNCKKSHIGMLSDMRLDNCGSDGMSLVQILSLDPNKFINLFKKKHKRDQKAFVDEMLKLAAEDPELLRSVPCDIMDNIIQKTFNLVDYRIQDDDRLTHKEFFESRIGVLPFLDRVNCEIITIDEILENADVVKDIDFMCDIKYKDAEDEEAEGSQSKPPATGATVDASGRRLSTQEEKEELKNHFVGCHYTCGKIIMKKLRTKMKDASPAELKIIKSLQNLRPCETFEDILKHSHPGSCHTITAEVLKATHLTQNNLAMRRLAEKCLPNKAPEDFTFDDVRSMGCTVVVAARLIRMPLEALCNVTYITEDLAECMDVLTTYRGKLERLCVAALHEHLKSHYLSGKFRYKIWPRYMLKEFRNVDITMALPIAKCLEYMHKARRSVMAFSMEQRISPLAALEHKEYNSVMSMKKFQDVLEKGGRFGKRRTEMDPDPLVDTQLSTLVTKFLKDRNIKSGADVTVHDLVVLGVLVRALPAKIVKDMENLDMMREICNQGGLSGNPADAAALNLMHSLMNLNLDNPIAALTEEDVYSMQTDCLKFLYARYVKFAPRNLRHAVCNKIGGHPRIKCMLSEIKRRELAAECIIKDDVDVDDSTYDYVTNSGVLLADVSPELLVNISIDKPTSLLKSIGVFRPAACLNDTLRNTLIEVLEGIVTEEDMSDSEKLLTLGDFAYFLHKDAQDPEFMAIYVTPEHLDRTDDADANVQCCEKDMSIHIKELSQDYEYNVAAAQVDVYRIPLFGALAMKRTNCSGNFTYPIREFIGEAFTVGNCSCGNITFTSFYNTCNCCKNFTDEEEEEEISGSETYRRKRDTTELSISIVLTAGQVVLMDKRFLTANLVDNMEDYEVANLFDDGDMGQIKKFSPEVELAFLNRILRIKKYAEPCDMSSDDVENLGSLADQLTVSEISCLDISNETLLGHHTNYSKEQLETFASRYLDVVNKVPADLNGENIAYMKHFVCGLSDAQIAQIPDSVYSDTSALVGTYELCSLRALKALAAKAKNVYGAVSTWIPAVFREAGALIGGLTAQELNTASPDHVEMWTSLGIRSIPVDVFKELNESLMMAMSSEQLRNVKTEQLKAMDASLQKLLEESRTQLMLQMQAEAKANTQMNSRMKSQMNSQQQPGGLFDRSFGIGIGLGTGFGAGFGAGASAGRRTTTTRRGIFGGRQPQPQRGRPTTTVRQRATTTVRQQGVQNQDPAQPQMQKGSGVKLCSVMGLLLLSSLFAMLVM